MSDPTLLLAAVQVLWAAVLGLLGLLGKRLHEDLKNNTTATQEIGRNLADLAQRVIGQYATKDERESDVKRHVDDLRVLTEKYDKLNREMGEVTVLMRLYSKGDQRS